ncbi:MAG TPA: hypothetical protein PL059_03390 [Spirochaetota bacterium]|nr:hypothetical protein [Spirochaetota bacterium]HOM09788.1 hypothetical protein [Spirochaetota bacterium]HPP49630.1 hypothetical protein [Spirochaetota bacterium]
MKPKDTIRKIIVIEIVVFLIIIVFIWAEEIFDLPHLLLNAEPTPVNYEESLIETFIFTAIFGFLVYHTIRLLIRLRNLESYVRICAGCNKIYVEGRWVTLEEYFNRYANKKTSHGLCDDCRKYYKK